MPSDLARVIDRAVRDLRRRMARDWPVWDVDLDAVTDDAADALWSSTDDVPEWSDLRAMIASDYDRWRPELDGDPCNR